MALYANKIQDKGENYKQRKSYFCFSLKFGKEGGQEKMFLFYRFSIHHRHWQCCVNVSCDKVVLWGTASGKKKTVKHLNILKTEQPSLWNSLPQMLKTQAVHSSVDSIPPHKAEFYEIEQEQTSPWHNSMRSIGAEPVKNLVCLVKAGGCLSTWQRNLLCKSSSTFFQHQPLMRDPTCRGQMELSKRGWNRLSWSREP